MRPGNRIALLRRLADRLAEDDYPWEDMDLVLRQFGFSTGDDWDGTKRSYALASLERGNDDSLVELDEYLFGGSSRENLETSDLPWETGTFRLFISHTSDNAVLAGQLRAIFARWRVDAFVAHSTIEPTREWQREIETALDSCQALTAIVTPDFVSSKWCDQEVGFCVARRIPIVPVRLGADPHGFIGKYQAARPATPGTSPYVADAIFRALVRHAAIRDAMAAPVVHRYAASTSFDGARGNFELLREVPEASWTRELVEVAERASTENNQIQHAVVLTPESMAMPKAVEDLLVPVRERLGMNKAPVPSDDDIPF